jgi:hypothetical protein
MKVVSIESKLPHLAGIVDCTECDINWIAVVPANVKQVECPECSKMIPLTIEKPND